MKLRLVGGDIIKKRLLSFAFEKTPCISLSSELVSVQPTENTKLDY